MLSWIDAMKAGAKTEKPGIPARFLSAFWSTAPLLCNAFDLGRSETVRKRIERRAILVERPGTACDDAPADQVGDQALPRLRRWPRPISLASRERASA